MDDLNIFLDLDGVMCDFSLAMCRTMNLDPLDPVLRHKLENNCFVSNEIDTRAFWQKVKDGGAEWWANIPILPWANSLWEELNKIATVIFLTAPHVDHESCAGKALWVQKNFKTDLFLIGKHKQFCASPKAVLIDDYVKNIQRFVAHDGHGYLWPNPDKLKNSGNWEMEIDKAIIFVKEASRAVSKKDILVHQ